MAPCTWRFSRRSSRASRRSSRRSCLSSRRSSLATRRACFESVPRKRMATTRSCSAGLKLGYSPGPSTWQSPLKWSRLQTSQKPPRTIRLETSRPNPPPGRFSTWPLIFCEAPLKLACLKTMNSVVAAWAVPASRTAKAAARAVRIMAILRLTRVGLGRNRPAASSAQQHLHIRVAHQLQDEVVGRGLARVVGEAHELGIARHAGLAEDGPDVLGVLGRAVGLEELGVRDVHDLALDA